MSFDEVRAGYWGRDADLARLGANGRASDDIKTRKFLELGEMPWSKIMM